MSKNAICNNVKRKNKYDVFISTPMAAWNDNQSYSTQRETILRIISVLELECNFKSAYYAGLEITSCESFDSNKLSAKTDFDALRESRYFICIYPEKLASGALVEVGAAIAQKIPTLLFVPSRKTLPYILEQIDQVFDFVRIFVVSDSNDIIDIIKNEGCSIFHGNLQKVATSDSFR